jgi:hypothetical protein
VVDVRDDSHVAQIITSGDSHRSSSF